MKVKTRTEDGQDMISKEFAKKAAKAHREHYRVDDELRTKEE